MVQQRTGRNIPFSAEREAARDLAKIMAMGKKVSASPKPILRANRQGGPPPYKVPIHSSQSSSGSSTQGLPRSSSSQTGEEGVQMKKRHFVAEGVTMIDTVDVHARVVDPHRNKKGWFANLGFFATFICIVFMMIFFGALGAGINYFINVMNTDAQMKQLIILEKMKQIESIPKAQAPAMQTSPAVISQNVVTVPMSACSTDASRDQTLAAEAVSNVDQAGVSYELPRGCTWAQFGYVKNLKGATQFIFNRRDNSSSTGFKGCGTIGGLNDSLDNCVNFINDNHGQPLFAIVASGRLIVNN